MGLSTNNNKIATVAECNAAGGNIPGDANRCTTFLEIIENIQVGYDVEIDGAYAMNQLVQTKDITYAQSPVGGQVIRWRKSTGAPVVSRFTIELTSNDGQSFIISEPVNATSQCAGDPIVNISNDAGQFWWAEVKAVAAGYDHGFIDTYYYNTDGCINYGLSIQIPLVVDGSLIQLALFNVAAPDYFTFETNHV